MESNIQQSQGRTVLTALQAPGLFLVHLYFAFDRWCLNVNLKKTQIIVFNQPGKLIKSTVDYGGEPVECVSIYRYLGITFAANGKFKQGEDELFKKSLKACFKLQ